MLSRGFVSTRRKMEVQMAQEGPKEGTESLLSLEVPLEPYPAPDLRAIDGEGNEFPPPPNPPLEKFEKMVRQYHLRRVAAKRSLPTESATASATDADAEGAEQELSTKLSSAIHSIDEAIVDMLNAASLLRTVRTDKSFIANETLSTSISASQLPHPPLPYSITPLELVLGLKAKSYSRAASEMTSWVDRTRTLLTRARRLTQDLSRVRRLCRLMAVSASSTLARPLSASDPIGLTLSPPNPKPKAKSSTSSEVTQPPLILNLAADGRPCLPALRDHRNHLSFRLIHGPTRACATTAVDLPPLMPSDDLLASVKALNDDAAARGLFEAVRTEAGKPGQAWTDRHGLAWGKKEEGRAAAMEVVPTSSEEDGGGGARRGAGVVCVREGMVMVEVDDTYVLSVELGSVPDDEEQEPGANEDARASPLLRRLSRLAQLVLMDRFLQGEEDLLAHTSTLLRHRIYREQVAKSVKAVVRDYRHSLGLGLELSWAETGMEDASARLTVAGGGAFMVDLAVGDGEVVVSTATAWAVMGRVRIERVHDLERYLGLHLARLVIHVLHRDLLCKEDLLLTSSSAKVREVEPWSGVAGLQEPGVWELRLWRAVGGEEGVKLECRVMDGRLVEALKRKGVVVGEGGMVDLASMGGGKGGLAGKVEDLLREAGGR